MKVSRGCLLVPITKRGESLGIFNGFPPVFAVDQQSFGDRFEAFGITVHNFKNIVVGIAVAEKPIQQRIFPEYKNGDCCPTFHRYRVGGTQKSGTAGL